MITMTIYRLEKSDPSWKTRMIESFNRVAAFCPELRTMECKVPHTKAKLFHRVCINGEFCLEDWIGLHAYGIEASRRAMAGAAKHVPEVKESIEQAAHNLREVLAEFDLWLATEVKGAAFHDLPV